MIWWHGWYKPFDDRGVYAAIGDSGNIIYVNKEAINSNNNNYINNIINININLDKKRKKYRNRSRLCRI